MVYLTERNLSKMDPEGNTFVKLVIGYNYGAACIRRSCTFPSVFHYKFEIEISCLFHNNFEIPIPGFFHNNFEIQIIIEQTRKRAAASYTCSSLQHQSYYS